MLRKIQTTTAELHVTIYSRTCCSDCNVLSQNVAPNTNTADLHVTVYTSSRYCLCVDCNVNNNDYS